MTCTFTNTKQGDRDREEGHGRRHRHVLVHGNAVGRHLVQNNGTISANVAPGQYLSTEAAKAGWDLTR